MFNPHVCCTIIYSVTCIPPLKRLCFGDKNISKLMSNLHNMYKCIVYDPALSLYRDVAIAFLSHVTWKKSMRVSVMKKDDHGRNQIVTPMRMLIEHMPGMIKCFCLLLYITLWGEHEHIPAFRVYIHRVHGNYT